MSQESAFKLLYSEVFKNGGDITKVLSKMHNQIKCYVKESFPYFLVADNYFYIPCYFTKKAVDQFKSKAPNVMITDLMKEVIIIQDWSLELAQVNSANVFTSYAGVELRLIVKSFKVLQGTKLSIIRYPVNIYRDSEIKNLISSFVNASQTAAISSGIKSESLPDISKFQSKANVSQGVVKFASGDTFSAYGFKSANTPVMDMNSIYKQEKGGAPKSKSPAKSMKPKIQGGSKVIRKSPKKSGASIAGKLAKFTPTGKKTTASKKSVGGAGGGTMASPGDGMSDAATAQAKTMKQFKQMLAYLKKNKSGKASKGGSGKKSNAKNQ